MSEPVEIIVADPELIAWMDRVEFLLLCAAVGIAVLIGMELWRQTVWSKNQRKLW